MFSTEDFTDTEIANPIDAVEQVAMHRDWAFDRRGDDEMAVEIPGQWCDFGLFFAWSPDLGTLHLSCAFDMRVPEGRRQPLYELLCLANERLWLGHFALWTDEGLPMFRHSLLMGPAGETGLERLEEVIEVAITESERFYPAFQYVIWGGKSAADAIAAAMLETVGEA